MLITMGEYNALAVSATRSFGFMPEEMVATRLFIDDFPAGSNFNSFFKSAMYFGFHGMGVKIYLFELSADLVGKETES